MQYMILLPLVCAIALPIIAKFKKVSTKAGAKRLLATNIVTFFVCVAVTVVIASAGSSARAADTAAASGMTGIAAGLGFIGAALVTMGSCIGAGIAVSAAATAALGAISEDGSLFGKALIFVVLGESIALYGLLISIQILNKI